jgi:hypothetical protein
MGDFESDRARLYRLGIPKESAAVERCRRFLLQLFDKSAELIPDDENYELGDLKLPNGGTLEVKGQPINPQYTCLGCNKSKWVYRENYVEVFEENTKQNASFEDLATVLDIPSRTLESVNFTPYEKVGASKRASVQQRLGMTGPQLPTTLDP